MSLRPFRLLSVLVVLTACASGGATQGSADEAAPRPAPREKRSSTTITAEEVSKSQSANALQAVQHLHPEWLKARAGSASMAQGNAGAGTSSLPIVYVNGQRWGTLQMLQQITSSEILSIRYHTASEAQIRFGLDNTGGAIEVLTQKHAQANH